MLPVKKGWSELVHGHREKTWNREAVVKRWGKCDGRDDRGHSPARFPGQLARHEQVLTPVRLVHFSPC